VASRVGVPGNRHPNALGMRSTLAERDVQRRLCHKNSSIRQALRCGMVRAPSLAAHACKVSPSFCGTVDGSSAPVTYLKVVWSSGLLPVASMDLISGSPSPHAT
jgi:hypothetical protein